MYTIRYYDKFIYIPGDADFVTLNPTLDREANKAGTLTFALLEDHPYYGQLEKLKPGIAVLDDDKVVFRGRVIDSEQNFYNEYEVTVEGKLAVLNDSPCRPHAFTGTPEELFSWFLENHNAQVGEEQKLLKGNVTVTDPNNYINRSWENTGITWDLMSSRLLDTLGGYFVVRYEEDGDYLDWLEGFDLYANQGIEFGQNLLDLNMFTDASETYTACIPYGAEVEVTHYGIVDLEKVFWEEETYYVVSSGVYLLIETQTAFDEAVAAGITLYTVTSTEQSGEKLTVASVNDGKDYIINDALAEQYGIIYAPTDLVTWGDVGRPENLLKKGEDWLNNQGVMLKSSVELSALDLSRLGIEAGQIDMYHNVRVISAPHNLEASYLVCKMSLKLDAPEDVTITLGSSELTLTDKNLGEKKKTDDVTRRINNIESDYVKNEQISAINPSYLHIRYSPVQEPSEEQMTEEPAEDTAYIGVCHTKTKGAPAEPGAYSWTNFKGTPGTGVASITTQYYLSTSKAELIGGEWFDDVPEWVDETYLWTREKIIYKDPEGISYTEPVCDAQWAAEYTAGQIATASSELLQTAEEITLNILEEYTSVSDLEEYKQEIENTLTANAEGFSFEFSQLEQRLAEIGGEIVEKNQFIRLEEGNIIIGKSDSPIVAVFTNDALEFRFNDQVVARFTNEVLEVRNIAVENQLRFGTNWAIRPGDYIDGLGYNLNDVWIGG